MMNSFINSKTNQKKLQYGVEKCHRMHVGSKDHLCPDLYIDSWEVKPVDSLYTGMNSLVDTYNCSSGVENSESEKYLGDIICKDGKNKKNIEARRGKGSGIKNQIMDMLDDVCFGPYHFEVAMVFRSSLLTNSVLTNSEAWLGLTLADMEQLEQVDEMLMRKILEVGQGCPKEMLYLELGCIPLRFTIMMRKLMFFHYLLNEEPDCLIHQVLQAQIRNPSKNDFIVDVESTLNDLDIHLSKEDIKSCSKESLHKFVKQQVVEKALLFLNKIKQKHSKVLHIKHESLKMQDYLMPENIRSTKLSKFLFSARCRMLDVKTNFSNMYPENKKCKLGCDKLDSQEHIMECQYLDDNDITVINDDVEYSDLFSSHVEKQLKVASVLEKRFMRRKEKTK